jgi:hypothetical protein
MYFVNVLKQLSRKIGTISAVVKTQKKE